MQLTTTTQCVYFDVAWDGMRRVLDRLDDCTVNQRPNGPESNSVACLVVHCCELTRFWLDHVGLDHPTDRDRDTEFRVNASVADVRARLDEVQAQCETMLGTLDGGSSALYHPARADLPGGDRSDAAVVLHVFQELFQHLGHMEITADTVLA